MHKVILVLDTYLMKYERGLPSKSPDLLGLKLSSIVVKCLQKRELNISAFKGFNKGAILVNKECMVLVCYPLMSEEFHSINF